MFWLFFEIPSNADEVIMMVMLILTIAKQSIDLKSDTLMYLYTIFFMLPSFIHYIIVKERWVFKVNFYTVYSIRVVFGYMILEKKSRTVLNIYNLFCDLKKRSIANLSLVVILRCVRRRQSAALLLVNKSRSDSWSLS